MDVSLYAHLNGLVRRDGWEKTAACARKLGFSSVELLVSCDPAGVHIPPSVEEATQIRRILAENGLHAACYSVGETFWGDSGAKEEMLREHVRRAAAIGSPFLHHTLILWLALPSEAPSYEQVLAPMTDLAVRTAEYARQFGVRCLYEPQGMYFNGRRGFGEFYRAVRQRTDNVGICADVGNPMFVDEELEGILADFAGDVCHVHLKDYRRLSAPEDGVKCYPSRRGVFLRETVIGEGDVHLEAILHLLGEVGYRGAFALENSHPEPYETGVRAAMELLKPYPEYIRR